jgi:hypothetical protein
MLLNILMLILLIGFYILCMALVRFVEGVTGPRA